MKSSPMRKAHTLTVGPPMRKPIVDAMPLRPTYTTSQRRKQLSTNSAVAAVTDVVQGLSPTPVVNWVEDCRAKTVAGGSQR
jgi:hypothetical protein